MFFRARDVDALRSWYEDHLGIPAGPYGHTFEWRSKDDPDRVNQTVFSIFPNDTDYFGSRDSQYMLNLIVDDLHATLNRLREAGVTVDEKTEEAEYGKFGWVTDPEGNRIELWEPPESFPE